MTSTMTSVQVAGIPVEVFEGGAGRPLLYLHGAGGINRWEPFMEALAAHHRVIAPSHPGYGETPRPDWLETVDDLAYFYLDFIDSQGLEAIDLAGSSLGGWIAAEVAVRCCHHLHSLTLIDAVGIKIGGRESRDIADIFTMLPDEARRRIWFDPRAAVERDRSLASPDLTNDERFRLMANQESTALYAWKPYMHNPQLRRRLQRIHVPTLVVWGESDGLVPPDYGRAYAASIPGARFVTIPRAAHVPQKEQPEAFVEAVESFLATVGCGGVSGRRPAGRRPRPAPPPVPAPAVPPPAS
jgi:pimeloyl-ACP methyl ester carboxylesterase